MKKIFKIKIERTSQTSSDIVGRAKRIALEKASGKKLTFYKKYEK